MSRSNCYYKAINSEIFKCLALENVRIAGYIQLNLSINIIQSNDCYKGDLLMSLLQFYSILHLLSAVTWIGGMIFVNFALVPGIADMAPEQRGAVGSVHAGRGAMAIFAGLQHALVNRVIGHAADPV